MARGIMAGKEENVSSPTSEQLANSTKSIRNTNTLNTIDHSSSGVNASTPPVTAKPTTTTTSSQSSPCSCTKISTMQLFYEMKQRFPTVPDNVVCEFVGQNCHNRSACIDCLEDYPNSATNVYPQALRNQPIKKKTSSATINPPTNQQNQSMANNSNANDNEQMTNPIDQPLNVHRKLTPPNTLNLINLNCCTRPVNRPTRQAPPPPIITTTAATPTTPTQSTKSQLNQPLNLSVNVIVSPVSRTSQQSQSHYSFTLHQPNNMKSATTTNAHPSTPVHGQSAAETTKIKTPTTDAQHADVGPSLTYTSSSYDADIGYKSRLEITVAGTSDNCDQQLNDNAHDANSTNVSLKRSIEHQQLPSVVASTEFLEETETIHHQILCKQKLVLELDKERKRLERMQRELQAIQAPMPDGGLHVLNQEIEKLRNDCKLMAQYVEEAGPSYALGETNEAFYRNIYTGQQLPIAQQRLLLRPHRPAPVPDFSQMQNRVLNHINLAGTDPRFTSSAAATAAASSSSSIPQPTLTQSFNESNEDGWVCDLCTFQNKYTQRTCEACTMPFLTAGNHMDYNCGTFESMPMHMPPSPLQAPLQSQSLQPQQSYPLTHYMPMPMPMQMPYSLHNNNNNIQYVHSSYYRPPQSMPPQFYVYDNSRF